MVFFRENDSFEQSLSVCVWTGQLRMRSITLVCVPRENLCVDICHA